MCYYIYGALYGDIDKAEYKKIEDKYDCKIHSGTKHNVKMCVKGDSWDYRVTDGHCDCGSALGEKNPDAKGIMELEALFNDIKKVEGAKHIYLCKTWAGKINRREVKLKLSDIDVKTVLAEFDPNCLYTFEI